MSHYINVCDCGMIISQCRCPGPKTRTIILKGCQDCKWRADNGLPPKPREVSNRTGYTLEHSRRLLIEVHGDVEQAVALGLRTPIFLGEAI